MIHVITINLSNNRIDMIEEIDGVLILRSTPKEIQIHKELGVFHVSNGEDTVFMRLSKEQMEALKNYLNINDLITAKRSLVNLTDEQRMEVFSDYCRYCGCDDPTCRCWDDE